MKNNRPLIVGYAALVGVIFVLTALRFAKPLFYPKKVAATEKYTTQSVAAERVDHAAFDALLKKYVIKGRLDYAGLKKDEAALRAYVKSLETLDAKRYSRDELLAMFVNAYNAATLMLIVEHYPGLASIKDIPAAKRWDDKRWTFCGELVSLSELEHGILRARFKEPRIHFAINCASIGCPPLRGEAYVGERIEVQLQDQALVMNRDFGGAQWDAEKTTLKLSKIYDWYEDDFTRGGALKDYTAQFFAPDVAETIKKSSNVGIVFQEYNWALNDIQK
ncbi:MAG: DUF547 domain-containing protein [Planctomycetota bacterium]